ncbi:hypothetical protein [Pseudonocardia alni]|uniref:hypothetical protein n=1 Tax=Pseudonocardia alni TaxID=33907 RepID=UPI00331BEEA5
MDTLTTETFTTTVGGRPGSIEDVLPGLTPDDRLALVVAEDGGSFAAAATVLAAVTDHYASLRRREATFHSYPDFYAVHVGRIRGWHGHIDIWPEHKEVVVPSAGEPLLTALNDRAVTRVLVPAGPRATGTVLRETLDRQRRLVRTALVYGAPGPVELTAGSAATALIRRAVLASPQVPGVVRERWAAAVGPTVEHLTPLDPADLPAHLLGLVEDRGSTGLGGPYRDAHGVHGAVLDRHVARVR